MRTMVSLLAILTMAVPATPADAPAAGKGKRPQLGMRAAPRFAFSPVTVLVTAELVGGEDTEDLHCPELQWEWDDGAKSVTESDCDPLSADSPMQRRYTAEHHYRRAGVYNVKLTLRRASKTVAQQSVRITVRSGLGDPTNDSNEN